MARRKNGEGTWGEKIINGIPYQYHRDSNGRYFYGKTIADVKKKIANSKEDSAKKISADVANIKKQTFGEYITNWLLGVKYLTIKRNTLDGYENCINGQIINYEYNDLTDVQVGTLTGDMLQEYITSLKDYYTKGSIKKIYAIISQCIKYGNKREHFQEFIDLDDINLPNDDIITKPKKEIHFLTNDDMKLLYKEAMRINTEELNLGGKIGELSYGNNANLLMFILYTGLRISEAIELTWEDVHTKTENPRIDVNKTAAVVKTRDGSKNKYEKIKSTTKTYSGNRSVPLNKTALKIINIEHNMHPKHKPSDYVFLNKCDEKIDRHKASRTLTCMMKRAGCSIDTCTPHELRHSFGSALLRNGIDIKVISKLLGHKDITVTYNIYMHILEEQKIDATTSIDLPE